MRRNHLWNRKVFGFFLLAVTLVTFGVLIGTRFFEISALPGLYKRLTIISIMRMDTSAPPCSTVFIGDSITQGLATNAVAESPLNFGIAFAKTEDLNYIIPELKAVKYARQVFLQIGTNDILKGSQEDVMTQLAKTNDLLPGNVHLVWSSIPPQNDEQANRTMRTVNAYIEELCARRTNCSFVDTHQIHAVHKKLPGDRDLRFESDGIHLSAEAYKAWIVALRASLVGPEVCQSNASTN